MYGFPATVENLAWSADRIIGTCEDNLRDKVRKQLVGVLALEAGGPLVLKLALDTVMNIDDSALRSLTQNLQTLWMKDVPGENFGTIVSYLKGDLLLLSNYKKMPTDVMGLLNDTIYSAGCEDFTAYMKAIYFNHTRKTEVMEPMKFLTIVEGGYRTLYRNVKWDASKSDPGYAFYVGEEEPAD